MTDLHKNEAKKALTFTGTFGNASLAHFSRTLAAAQIGDKVYLGVIPKGSRVFGATMYNAALGASSTVSLGREAVDGSDTPDDDFFLGATSTASGAKTEDANAPWLADKDYYVYGIVGGAAATGALNVALSYSFEGVK